MFRAQKGIVNLINNLIFNNNWFEMVSIGGAEQKAKELEQKSSMELYDRNSFEKALYAMIKNHNRDEGISLLLVTYYLNAWCKKD